MNRFLKRIRQLENEVERAMTLAITDKEIKEEHLSPKLKAASERSVSMDGISGATLQQVTETIEQRMIREALKETKGNKSGAARTLGLTRQGLLNKIARYNIQT